MNKNKLVWILIILLIVVLLGGGIWYWLKLKEKPLTPEEKAIKASTQVVTPKVVTPSNPVGDKLPDLNPVTKTNPFKNVYKNPFE